MKSKWSKVIKSENQRLAVHSFEMTELIPMFMRNIGQHHVSKEEQEKVEEVELPHDCSALQTQAFEAGRVAGIEEGTLQCRQKVEQETERALMLVGQVEEARARMLHQAESDLVELALAIAKKVIHREASTHKDIVLEQVGHILKNLATSSGVCLYVHPDEVEYLQTMQSHLMTHDGNSPAIRIESDPAMELGGCLLQTEGLSIDAGIESQLKIIGEALQPQSESDETVEPSSTS
ncbi:FliH/SctL family protein [Candidatus Nitrospira salsa]